MNPQTVASAPTTEELQELALEVRTYLAKRREEGAFTPQADAWTHEWNPEFSRELAAKGWVGMTIPPEYGGHGRSHAERFVVAEEMLASGAPVAFHWVTERQIGPQLLKLGTPEQREKYIPGIVRAEIAFALGMSEPGSGSDLASVRTKAEPVEGGFIVNGQKIWTSSSHRADYVLALVRTSQEENHHAGLSQLIIDLKNTEGVVARPIPASIGDDHLAEVFFEDAFVPEENLVGVLGAGWQQVTAELGYERGGSDRFMSNMALLEAFVGRTEPRPASTEKVGELVARMLGLRTLAAGVMESAGAGRDFAIDAALATDAGNVFEQEMTYELRGLGVPDEDEYLVGLLEHAMLYAPTISLRGGSAEVLRGITAKNLVGR